MASTIYDIAERANVSTATVSRVFNEESKVSPDTRERVIEAAQALNYQPHAMAQGLARQRTHLISAVVPVLANYFYMGVLRGVQDALATSEFDLLVLTPSHPQEIATQLRRASQSGRSDGLLFLSTSVDEEIADILGATAQEVVLLDTEHPNFESISIDNERGGYEATRHLVEQGRTRIAHITADEPEPPPAAKRRRGYERALSEASGVAAPMIARGDKEPFAFEREGGYRAMKRLLEQDPLPDAVFAASDMQALGAMRALEERGLTVPDDVAIVGFDDIDISEYVGLTTLRQPLHDLGQLAIEKMIGRIENPDRPVSSSVFSPELRVRASSGGEAGEVGGEEQDGAPYPSSIRI
jgi:LacI family transcriptional regulator